MSTKHFTNNFKTTIIKFKRFNKFFTRPTQAKFQTLKNKCQTSLATATDLEQYRQGLIQTLKQFSYNQDNEENEDVEISYDSYVDLELILYGRPLGQSR